MSAASSTWKAVKAHVPLIKFRKGIIRSHADAASSTPSNAPAVGTTPRGSGIDESLLPRRYLRKPLTSLEIEVIQQGGPDNVKVKL